MSPHEIAALIVSIITITTAFMASIRWLVKHYLAELRPNGGGSLKDQVNRLENRMNDADDLRQSMSSKIDRMYEILLEHVARGKD